MAKKKTPNDLYWQHLADEQVKNEYTAFLAAEQLERTPHSAHLFSLRKRTNGYREKTERELILLVAGELPYMYD